MQSRGEVSARVGAGDGRAGIFWREPQRVWLRGDVQRGVWAGHAGVGARGQRAAVVRERAVGASDVSDLCVWQRRAKGKMAAAVGEGRKAWLLWIDGA